MRMVFGIYLNENRFVFLWGTEDYYRNPNAKWPGPECVDGVFVWEIWREENE